MSDFNSYSMQRESLNMLLIADDLIYINYLMNIHKKKGVRFAELPSIYDA